MSNRRLTYFESVIRLKRLKHLGRLILVAFAFSILLGCKPNTEEANGKSSEASPTPDTTSAPLVFEDGLSAKQILGRVEARYQSAKTYRDAGVLDLSYRLNGQTLSEPKRFSTAFDSKGNLSVQAYNTHLRGNGRVLACEVFDRDTANLDDQKLLIPYQQRLPLEELFRDSIASHFVAGFAELPLAETDKVNGPKLIPAPLSLLTGQMKNQWLQSPQQQERLADQTLGKNECYVVRSLAHGMTADIWVDQKSSAVIKMSLPIKLLAKEVVGSPQVTDVILVAKYLDVEFDQPVDSAMFAQPVKDESVWVRKFVSLPEPLPSELIGRASPKFQLLTPEGGKVDRLAFDEQTLTLIWVEGADAIEEVAKFASEVAKLKSGRVKFGLVYSDAEVKRRSSGNFEPYSRIKELGENLGMPLFYDPQHSISSRLQVKSIPAAVVMDGDSKIQFATVISGDDWPSQLSGAIARVAKGENVSAEMKDEYAQYLDTYYQQLTTVSAIDAASLLAGASRIKQASASTGGTLQIDPRLAWRCDEFKRPGNIASVLVGRESNEMSGYAIFDGWQTMGLVTSAGKLARRERLGLAENEAATTVRQTNGGPQQWFSIFAPYGQASYIFNQKFSEPVRVTLENGQKLRDVRFSDLDKNGISEVLLAIEGGGIEIVDPASGDRQQISTVACESLVGFAGDVLVLKQGKVRAIKSDKELNEALVKESGWSVSNMETVSDKQLLLTGKNRAGKWSAMAFDDELQRLWTLEIGPQMYESTLQPIAVTQWRQDFVWAIADSNHLVQLVTGSGKWIGEFQSKSPISGMALSQQTEDVFLTIASETGIESWALQLKNE